MNKQNLIEQLEKAPVAFRARDLEQYTGGEFTRSYASVLRSEGKGPKYYRLGRRVVYKRVDVLAWAKEQK